LRQEGKAGASCCWQGVRFVGSDCFSCAVGIFDYNTM
jgi:hypothetical protein